MIISITSVWRYRRYNEPIKEFFAEVSSTKLLTKPKQIVLHNSFTYNIELRIYIINI